MSANTSTFRPWKVVPSPHQREFTHWIETVEPYRIEGFADRVTVAAICNRNRPDETDATAHLIAAAPDLYWALKDALAELSPLMQAYRPAHEAGICEAMRAAIAKAEGDPRG